MHVARILASIVSLSALTLGLGGPLARPAHAADTLADADRAAEDAIDEAERALHRLRYEQAGTLLERARRSGQNGPHALARVYRLQGELAATLGDVKTAEGAFARWLAIDPGAALDPGTSPKITGPFEAAAAGLGGAALEVEFHVTDDRATVALEVHSDPLAMIRGARAFYRGRSDVAIAEAGRDPLSLALPPTGRPQVTVAALDQFGNRLAERELTLDRETRVEIPPAPPRKPPPAPALRPRPSPPAAPAPAPRLVVAPAPAPPERSFRPVWIWGSVAVGFGALGGYFGWRAARAQTQLDRLNGESGQHTYLEASDTAARLRTDAILADSSFVLAGVCAVTAVLLWPEARPARPQRRASWQLGPGEARVALEWSF